MSFCSVLGQGACPIAFWAGDLDAAERYGAMPLDHTEQRPIRLWQIWARCLIGLVAARCGEIDAGLRALRDGLGQAGEARFLPRFLLLGELAVCLGQAGEIAMGLETVDEALARCEARDEGWYTPELLCIGGELILLPGAKHASGAAEQHFRRALDWAHGQGALLWELRAATNLARPWRDRGSSADARDLLGSICPPRCAAPARRTPCSHKVRCRETFVEAAVSKNPNFAAMAEAIGVRGIRLEEPGRGRDQCRLFIGHVIRHAKTQLPGGRHPPPRDMCGASGPHPDHWIDRRFHGRHYPAVYNGTKAFLDSFSFAVRHKLKDTGVSVTCLTPDAFETDSLKSAKQKERSGGSR